MKLDLFVETSFWIISLWSSYSFQIEKRVPVDRGGRGITTHISWFMGDRIKIPIKEICGKFPS